MQDLAVISARSCGTAPCFPEAISVKSCAHRRVLDSTMDNRMTTNAESILEWRCGGSTAWRFVSLNDFPTTHTGTLGSVIHVLRADPETVAELSAVDWSRHFRRVCLDPVRGVITLMAPSHLHEDLTDVLDRIVDAAGSVVSDAVKGIRSTRLRGPAEPPGTGMEPDCAFYVGERANGYYAARDEGDAAVVAFVERTAPDLVVETEISSFDESKIARYGDLGVRELWRLHARQGSDELRVDFLVLRAGTAPRELDASVVLAGLTPDDVCEAVEKVRSSRTLAERTEAVSRIVLRRQRAIVRVREEEESYSASTGQPESARATGV